MGMMEENGPIMKPLTGYRVKVEMIPEEPEELEEHEVNDDIEVANQSFEDTSSTQAVVNNTQDDQPADDAPSFQSVTTDDLDDDDTFNKVRFKRLKARPRRKRQFGPNETLTYNASQSSIALDDNTSKNPDSDSRKFCKNCCYCCISKYHAPSDDASRLERFFYGFMCPPHGRFVKIITLVIIGLIFWATFWAVLGKQALPGGNFFGIIWVWILSASFGIIAELCRLPRVIGTLLGGLLSSNIPFINFGKDIDKIWFIALKKMAIVIVLIRAGLGLDLRTLWRHKYVVARMGTVPMVMEGVAIAIASRYLLGFPWIWSFLTGFTIAPMSAAATIPFMIGFDSVGLGIDKNIPSIVQLGAVWDNVLGLCVFSTFVGVVFTDESLWITILELFPMQIAVAIVGGTAIGVFLWYFPHKHSKQKVLYRFIFLLGGCVVGAFGTRLPQFSAVGPLANVVIAMVASVKWRQQGWTRTRNPLIPIFSLIWIGTQIMLSGLIGSHVDLSHINWQTVGIDLGVLIIGMSIRMVTQFLMAHFCKLNYKEKMFVTLAWIPKATIQAAIGSIAYDLAVELQLPAHEVERGESIFILSVLAIALWACIGAVCISQSGPRLLKKTPPRRSATERRFDVKDACVQTGPALLASLIQSAKQGKPMSRQRSFYKNYTRRAPPSAAIYDPITKEMGNLLDDIT